MSWATPVRGRGCLASGTRFGDARRPHLFKLLQHFNAVHVAIAQSGEIKGTKGEKVAALINKGEPPHSISGDREPSQFYSGKINDQHVDVNFIEVRNV